MSTQYLSFRSGKPLIIDTLNGRIQLWRINGDTRKLKIELPPGVKAWKDDDKADQNKPQAFKLEEKSNG